MKFEFNNKSLDLSTPIVMGIVNITPDSFFDGGTCNSDIQLLSKAEAHLKSGAPIIDIGAYSSRPGADFVSEEDETSRLLPAIKKIITEFPSVLLSIDTFLSNVAQKAIEAGAFMINDISGGNLDNEMFKFIGTNNIPYVLMHMRGTPETMQTLTNYNEITSDIVNELQTKVKELEINGAKQIVIDPGFGFAKTLDQNYQILKELKEFNKITYPLLIGVSRKSMIYKKLGINPTDALNGTTVLNTIALQSGAKVLRVHDSLEAQQTIDLLNLIK